MSALRHREGRGRPWPAAPSGLMLHSIFSSSMPLGLLPSINPNRAHLQQVFLERGILRANAHALFVVFPCAPAARASPSARELELWVRELCGRA